jgi:D-alanyl-D-alanine carboxypeptidase (penicillin-binding protein 5/6)
VLTCAALVAAVVGAVMVRPLLQDTPRTGYLARTSWPKQGQASYTVGDQVLSSPGQAPVPIASLAKVMTAYLTLRAFPLDAVPAGPAPAAAAPARAAPAAGVTVTVSEADVGDTAMRHARDESIVPVAAGEVLTERQALAAILLPSANNVAVMLARAVGGSADAFVAEMNSTARQLGMTHTRYSDPSGFDEGTVSTAADQVLLAERAMQLPAFAALVAMPTYQLPVAGTVHNTDILLGKSGFVGIKTGSDDAAGGCFMFRVQRTVDGTPRQLTGVILGQHGRNLIEAGQYAALEFAGRVEASTTP